MDEQRIEAYWQLIQQLLACPAGEEESVLQAQVELVDAGLVEVMGLVAEQMVAEGHNNAGWLRQFAGQVAQALGLEQSSASSAEDMDQFVGEVMVQISQTQGNRDQVYGFWQANLERFNPELLSTLPISFQRLIGQNDSKLTAAVFGEFGNLIQQFPLGVRWLNLELAIAAYERALEVYTREAFPQDWAMIQNNLAAAYSNRIRGERADNLEQAIAAYERALEVYTREAFPENWAATQNNLAVTYRKRIRGEQADNLEQAIAAYERALEVYTREAFSENWAATQNNLAVTYHNRIRGERADNLERAIAAYEQALEVYTREAFPQDWAMTQNNLANAYGNRIRGERADNLEQAIAAYEQALEVYTREAFPQDWAMTQNNLANAYGNRIRGERADNLEQAIAACKRVLEVRTREAFPEDWAATQNNLANAYRDRIRGERADNLEQAIAACKRALEVRTREAFPQDWAATQNNLANAYRDRVRGERADNLEQAITASERALEVYTREAFPQDWAATQNNLANAYRDRVRGERADNLEQAITASERALEVYTREAFPQDWAMTQNNLAAAYSNRIRGERADNLERAITAYERALEVYTREAFPQDWAMTQNNLAVAYGDRIRGKRADNLEQEIAAYERVLEVYTREAFPKDWAMTQNNLATAYGDRIRGERADNLERAIAAYQRALEVRTREAFPDDCRRTSRLLGNLQSELQNWDAATQAYGQALAAAEDLYQACTLLDSQAGELKETADLPRRAAYAYTKAGQLDKALETIERGRARGLSERLQRDRADFAQLQKQRPDLFDRYRDITNQLQNLESQQREQQIRDRQAITPEQHRNEAQRLRQELTEAIAQIRQVPGYETFLQAPSLTEIQQNLSTEAPTVYLIPTPNGSLALIATPQAIDPLWLDDFPEATLTDLVQTWLQADRESKVANYEYSKDPESLAKMQTRNEKREQWHNAIDQGTRQLWDKLMAPLIDRLKQHNHTQAILIPTGLLGLLPLHAAWTEDPSRPTGRRYALDELTFTYAPNAQSLVAARAIAQQFPDSHLDSILAIDDPTRNDPSQRPLKSSTQEVDVARSCFSNFQCLRHDEATIDEVCQALPNHAIVHLSCHGKTEFFDPLTSGLAMSNGRLTLSKLFSLKLTEGNKRGIRLAILSACETGLPGLDLADEAIGLPVGLLQAGVAGAIASLWAVSDLSTMILLTKFYDLWRNDRLTPPAALRQAQQWLRNATLSEIRQLTGISFRGAEHPFAHPYYWAGFSYTGI